MPCKVKETRDSDSFKIALSDELAGVCILADVKQEVIPPTSFGELLYNFIVDNLSKEVNITFLQISK
jgi:hypothetical protein